MYPNHCYAEGWGSSAIFVHNNCKHKTFKSAMKKTGFIIFFAIFIAACNNRENTPDISNVTVTLKTERFDVSFFSLDTNHLAAGLAALQSRYPKLLPVFLKSIVGVDDENGIKNFFGLYKPLYDSSQKLYQNFENVQGQIEKALKYVKYYFPGYITPARIIPIVGPMNTMNDLAKMGNGDLTPNFMGPDFIGISLQFYLGKDFSWYNQEYFINTVVPLYRSRRFSREYIVADVMKLVADDLFPDRSNTKPLIEQMIERGKHWWLIDKFLPGTPDSIKTGYTQQQLDWCNENEGLIWGYIIKNEDLYDLSPATIQTYIGESPFTQVFSQEYSPGNLGPWIGLQIVKKYAEKQAGMKPEDIMKASARQILEGAKYKPK